jgi:hypothetical protein
MHVRRLTSCLDTDEAFEEEFAGKSAKSEGWHRIPLAQQPSVVLTERIKNELLPAEKIVSLEKHSERVAFESKPHFGSLIRNDGDLRAIRKPDDHVIMFKRRIVRLMQNDMIFFHFYAQGLSAPRLPEAFKFSGHFDFASVGIASTQRQFERTRFALKVHGQKL